MHLAEIAKQHHGKRGHCEEIEEGAEEFHGLQLIFGQELLHFTTEVLITTTLEKKDSLGRLTY
jgi:hypothetical protein